MNRLHTIPSFKEILTEKRRELLGTSLVVLIILMQVTTHLVNFLKKDEVHGLYTYTYSMNVQGIILLIVPSIGISLLIVKGLYMLKAVFPQLMSTRKQKTPPSFLHRSSYSLANIFRNWRFRWNELYRIGHEDVRWIKRLCTTTNQS